MAYGKTRDTMSFLVSMKVASAGMPWLRDTSSLVLL